MLVLPTAGFEPCVAARTAVKLIMRDAITFIVGTVAVRLSCWRRFSWRVSNSEELSVRSKIIMFYLRGLISIEPWFSFSG